MQQLTPIAATLKRRVQACMCPYTPCQVPGKQCDVSSSLQPCFAPGDLSVPQHLLPPLGQAHVLFFSDTLTIDRLLDAAWLGSGREQAAQVASSLDDWHNVFILEGWGWSQAVAEWSAAPSFSVIPWLRGCQHSGECQASKQGWFSYEHAPQHRHTEH